MTIWLDAQLSPHLAPWITENLGIECWSVSKLGMQDQEDAAIFEAARRAKVVVMTKDADFVRLLETHGPPPSVIWVTCGNTSNEHLREILVEGLPTAAKLIEDGEPLVEITDKIN